MQRFFKNIFTLVVYSVVFIGCTEDKREISISLVAGPSVDFITPTKVTITWETDVPGNDILDYGSTVNLDSSYIGDEERQFHSVTIAGLDTNTTYYYQVTSISLSFDTQVSSKIDSFTTGFDINIVTGPTVEPISPTEVIITWDTDTLGNSIVEYGLNKVLDLSSSDDEERKSHSVNLTNLVPDTLYFYRVISISSALNAQISSKIDSFFTMEEGIFIVMGPSVEHISPTEVNITWVTDVPGNSILDYGNSADLGLQIIIPDEQQQHSVDLINLITNTTYYFRVTSEVSATNAAVSSEIVSFTNAQGEINIISSPFIVHISNTEVGVNWETDVPGNSIVEYGLSVALGTQEEDPVEQSTHNVSITGLVPDSKYYYRVTSVSSLLNAQVTSTLDSFYTSEFEINIVSPPSAEQISPTEVRLSWDTDVPGNSIVDYGITFELGTQVIDSEEKQTHSITLTELSPGTNYYYRVTSVVQASNTQVSSAIDSFTTIPGEINIVSLPSVNLTSPTEVTITWDTDVPGNSTVDYGNTIDLGIQTTDPEEQEFHSISLTDLVPGTKYYFRVTSVSTLLNAQVSSPIDSFTTAQGEINIISPPSVNLISPTEVTVIWDTDVSGNSIVDYGNTAELGVQIVDPVEQEFHSISLTDLAPGTKYYFQVTSVSTLLSAQVSSAIDSFTTAQGEINIISPPSVNLISPTEVTIIWDTDVPGNSVVDYGNTIEFGIQTMDPEEQVYHSISLTDLVPDTKYYFQVSSESSVLNILVSSEIDSFTTDPGEINLVMQPSVEIFSTEVIITWDTDIAGNSIVDYGETMELGIQIADSTEQLFHSITVTNLTPGTLYYYRVTSVASLLNAQVSSEVDSFTTSAAGRILSFPNRDSIKK